MASRGRKAKPAKLKAVAGTSQPSRATQRVVRELTGEPQLPAAYQELRENKPKLADQVLRTWNAKLETYRARGQSVVGCEDTLLQYCLLEVALINEWAQGMGPQITAISQHRVYANEFYDTPAAQVKTAGSAGPGNKFGNNGKKR